MKFTKLLKVANNPYASVANNGLICGDITGYFDTGIATLNILISGKVNGGIPKGRVVALAGEKGTGKTLIILNSIKQYLDSNKEGFVIFFESEGAISKKMLEERGIDTTRVLVFPVGTVEEFRTQAVNILDSMIEEYESKQECPDCLFCLDSLGMLGTEHEYETAKSGDNKSDMGKRAQLIKSVFRIITLKLSLLQIPMIINNHTYQGMSTYAAKKMSGGQGLEFAASIIVFLTKSKISNADKIKLLSGNVINMTLHKGRLTIEGSKVSTEVDFKKGVSRYAGILPLLIDAGILKKKGAWISYEGENIAHGDKKFYEIVDNFMNDDVVINKFNDYIQEKFCYGTAEIKPKEESDA